MPRKKLSACIRRPSANPAVEESTDDIRIKDLDDHDKEVACRAMKAMGLGLTLGLEYNGSPRVVEVHAVGLSTAGKPCMRVYQLQGASNSGEDQGWKLMSLGKVFEMPKLMDIHSLAPREGYRKGDLGMTQIFTEL